MSSMPHQQVTPVHVGCYAECCPGNTLRKILRMDVSHEVAVEKVKKNLFGDQERRDGREFKKCSDESTERAQNKALSV